MTDKAVVNMLADAIEAAAVHNPNDSTAPVAILWPDPESQWLPLLPALRGALPRLLTLGDYDPDEWTGPAIWLRCVLDGAVSLAARPSGGSADLGTPVLYLPGVGRGDLASAEECPARLKPLVELQYRGTTWLHKNGKPWTPFAFLSSSDSLGLDVADDAGTKQALLRGIRKVGNATVASLSGRRLEAEDFDLLLADDLNRDVLVWLGGGDNGWDADQRGAFEALCRAKLALDPARDGTHEAALRLGQREGAWDAVWKRFAEAPSLYPGVEQQLRAATPSLFPEPRESWPTVNEQEEGQLRAALAGLGAETPAAARERILDLERSHGQRRGWVWESPLADALEHLATLADQTRNALGGMSPDEMAKTYSTDGWRVDAAALASLAAVRTSVDFGAIGNALDTVYQPWLANAAEHLQTLAEAEPIEAPSTAPAVEASTVVLFADGLRLDVGHLLRDKLTDRGRDVNVATGWAALPTVTATGKPAVSPIAGFLKGLAPDEDFSPNVADTGQTLNQDRLRKLLASASYQWLASSESGDPSGRAWTEDGALDHLGHASPTDIPGRIDEWTERAAERVEALLDAGWREVRIVTDHGWLWSPSALPKAKLPLHLTESRWARCAAIRGASRVETPTVPWHWNPEAHVAMAPGIACFKAGTQFAHGGLSLQEAVVPTLRVTAGVGRPATRVGIAEARWAGFRCRVRIEPPQQGLVVDIRTKPAAADSSVVSEPRASDEDGTARLLVEDDDYEGVSASVVVLGSDGTVLASEGTVVGGSQQ